MSNSVDALKTVAECDYLLNWLSIAKKTTAGAKLTDEAGEEKITGSTAELEIEITETTSKIAGLTPLISTLPEGDYKEDKTLELSAANTKLLSLNKRKRSHGAPARVLKEMEVTIGGFELQVYTDKEAQITARRAAIAG